MSFACVSGGVGIYGFNEGLRAPHGRRPQRGDFPPYFVRPPESIPLIPNRSDVCASVRPPVLERRNVAREGGK